MFKKLELHDGNYPVFVKVDRRVEARLRRRRFRGPEIQLAGNFSRFRNVRNIFADVVVLEQFVEDVQIALDKGTTENSLCVDAGRVVGWESTDDIDKYPRTDLEHFTPNGVSVGLRVRRDTAHLAPQTKILTIVYKINKEQLQTVVEVVSLYPGQDCGEIEGDVTAREHCVFFDWNHPGVALAAKKT